MRKSSWFGRLCLAAAGLLCTGASALGAPGDVVISQVWGGPSSSTGTANQPRADYVELFNRTGSPVNLFGMSLNIATGSGTTWSKLDLSGSIPARSYYLVRVSADATAGTNLPTPDAQFGTLSYTVLTSTSGKVCLRDTTDAIGSVSCPSTNVLDLVTYGSSGTCFEGLTRAPAGSTTAPGSTIFRRGDGCTDTNDNANDFVTRVPAPRNSATAALASCDIGACCDNNLTGVCVLDTAAGCAASGYSFTTVGTTCAPHPCTPTGACCSGGSFTTCAVRTEAACLAIPGRWTLNAACLPDSACSSATACCLPDGSCCPMVAVLCTDMGGTFGAYAAGCTTAGNCIPPAPNDLCANATELTLGMPIIANCWNATSTDDGPATPCLNSVNASTRGIWFTFVPPATGIYEIDTAGTAFNSDLVVFSIPNCANPASWTVIGCDDQSVPNVATPTAFCGASTGAQNCGKLTGTPLQGGLTYHIRVTLNGTSGSGNYRIVVNSVAAAPTGACCFATNGRCEIRTQAGCTSAEAPLGTYLGDGVACSPSPCAPATYGACCSSGNCQIRIESGCTGSGAFWLEGAACEPSPCELTPNPPNGTCATATVISEAQLPFSAIVGVNQAPDGPAISCSTATVTRNAVWYVYTPPADGVVSAFETGARDVSVVVFDAGTNMPACNAWIEVLCESTEGDANFPAVAGHTYYILFTTPGTASSSVNDFYNIQIRRVVPTTPANSLCATATALSSSPNFQSFPAGGAPIGPRSQCQTLNNQLEARNAIWFTYSTGANDELVRLQRANNQTFFSLQFYTGDCNNLTDWTCANLGTANGFVQLRKNTTYTIMAHKRSGYLAGDASYQFIFDTSTSVAQIPNQDCTTATPVTTPFFATVDNTMAFDDPPSVVVDCPTSSTLFNPDPSGAGSVWYSYTPTAPSVVKVEETNTNTTTVVAAFEGSCGGPRVMCSQTGTDTSGSNLFRAYPPNTYYIIVAMQSAGIPSGTTNPLNISITAEETLVPPNDDCGTANAISALPYSDTAPIGGARDDSPRAVCSAGVISNTSRNGVWYTYHNGPSAAGVLLSETGPLDSIVAAYSGTCGDLVREICVDDPESNMYLTLRPNTTYYFMVAKRSDFPAVASTTVTFNMELHSSVIDPPANDTCDLSQVVTTMPFSYTGLPLAAANLFNPPTCAFNAGNLLVAQATDPLWYAIDSGTGFTLYMYELASSPSVVWTIFASCDQQFEQFCDVNEGTAAAPRTFALLPSTRYYLRVSRESNSDYTLGATPYNLTLTAAPGSNGSCCNGGPCTTTTIENCPSGFTPGGTCSPDPCAPSTEFCCRGTTCNSVTAGTCTGVIAGSQSIVRASCGSGNAFASCCFADFNHDGLQSIDDLFLYFNAYFTSSPMADFGGTGTSQPTIDDLFLYINAYFGTCS